MEPHNSFLQAFVEFGWLGGLFMALAVIVAGFPLLRLSKSDNAAKFALCSLAYIVMISLAHGRLSRDMLLFAMLGIAAATRETLGRTETAAPLRAVLDEALSWWS
jgi:O-antigen ligase